MRQHGIGHLHKGGHIGTVDVADGAIGAAAMLLQAGALSVAASSAPA